MSEGAGWWADEAVQVADAAPRRRDIRPWLGPVALLIAVLSIGASAGVYATAGLPQTLLAWFAFVASTVAAVAGAVAAVLGPRRAVAVTAVIAGVLAHPWVLWALITAASTMSPY